VDQPPADRARARVDRLHPASDVLVLVEREELVRAVVGPVVEVAEPGVGGDVGDRVVAAGEELGLAELNVGHREQPLGLHRVAVDRILVALGRVGVEMPEAAADERRAAHLPHKPRERLGTRRVGLRQQEVELLGQVDEDRTALEYPERLRSRAVDQRGDLAIGVDVDEARPELVALEDLDRPGVVLGVGEARLEQLLEHDRHLHPVRRAERVELEGMLADRELALLARARGRAVDSGELAAVFRIVIPDFGRGVDVGHRPELLLRKGVARRWRLVRGTASAREPLRAAMASKSPALQYVDDQAPGITRKKVGRGWAYFDPNGKRITDRDEIDRLNRIALPPAYTSAWFCPSDCGHLLATGIDARGRKQYRYNPEFRMRQEAEKFDGCADFGRSLPKVRKRVAKDLRRRRLCREQVVASVVRLLDLGAIRV